MNRGATNSTNFQAAHGDLLQCNICKYTLLATRKYLMELHITRRHEGKPSTHQRGMFGKRKLLPKLWALSARVFFYIIEQGESTKEVSRRLHYHQTSTVSHTSPVGKTPGGPTTPIIPLRSSSLCVSLGIHMEVDLYGVNPTTSERECSL